MLQLIEDQLKRTEQVVDALMLVGGFSGSEYLFKRVDVREHPYSPNLWFRV